LQQSISPNEVGIFEIRRAVWVEKTPHTPCIAVGSQLVSARVNANAQAATSLRVRPKEYEHGALGLRPSSEDVFRSYVCLPKG
jgi:hypothetical protein